MILSAHASLNFLDFLNLFFSFFRIYLLPHDDALRSCRELLCFPQISVYCLCRYIERFPSSCWELICIPQISVYCLCSDMERFC